MTEFPELDPSDWHALIDAEKDARNASIRWEDSLVGSVVVARRMRLDLHAITDRGTFTLWVDGEEDPGNNTQFRLMMHGEGLRRMLVSRLCCCRLHSNDDHPVHWHHFDQIQGIKTEVRPVLSLLPGMITRDELTREFLSTMKIRNCLEGMV